MAVTKIWRIKGRADKVISYASNIEKTSFSDSDRQALADVIEYAANEDKTERRIFVSAINCSPAFAKAAASDADREKYHNAACELLRIQNELEKKFLLPRESDFKWQ